MKQIIEKLSELNESQRIEYIASFDFAKAITGQEWLTVTVEGAWGIPEEDEEEYFYEIKQQNENLRKVLMVLSPKEIRVALDNVRNISDQLYIHSTAQLCYLLRGLKEEQKAVLFQEVSEKLPYFIHPGRDFRDLLEVLDPEHRTIVLNSILESPSYLLSASLSNRRIMKECIGKHFSNKEVNQFETLCPTSISGYLCQAAKEVCSKIKSAIGHILSTVFAMAEKLKEEIAPSPTDWSTPKM